MNLCLSLITQSQEDTAFHILKTFPTLQSESFNTEPANLGNFFLRHCVNMDTVKHFTHCSPNLVLLHVHLYLQMSFLMSLCALQSMEKIGIFCKELQDSDLHTAALSFTLSCALETKKTGTAHP